MSDDNESKAKFNWLDWRVIIIVLAAFIVVVGVAYGAARIAMSPPEWAKKSPAIEYGPLVKAGEFVVNIADGQGRRFLKTEVVLELANKDVQKDFETKLPVVQDRILALLSSKTILDLQVEHREKLKQDLLEQINTALGSNQIKMVYFTIFIIQ